ncbi:MULTISPECIES: hypothetical protein [unclassified Ensifer]|nr:MULTISPECIES: hypothetical protein [unclassified Ensifer]
MPRASAYLKRFIPSLAPVSHMERLRASLGALIGILLTGFVGYSFD